MHIPRQFLVSHWNHFPVFAIVTGSPKVTKMHQTGNCHRLTLQALKQHVALASSLSLEGQKPGSDKRQASVDHRER